ncbi:hypothetical protein EDD17DRAFT_1771942 [Pisolithus thermaeus]|nr:hypothetical protein EDD17DRAFT_1771942 [Pisolithus thermaeus]
MANMSSVAEEFVPTPTINICETTAIVSGVVMDSHSSATVPTETMENPWSEAPKMNTACAGTSLQSHLGKHSDEPYISSKVVLKELDYLSSLCDDLYKFMQEQMKECNELIKAFEGAQSSTGSDTKGIPGVPPREVTAGSVAEEVVQMLRMDAVGHLYSTLCCKANSRKHHQLAVVKNEIMSDKEWNDNLEHIRELFSHVFSVTGDGDFLSYELLSCEVITSFTEGSGLGPDPINLQWDFSSLVSLLWNKAIIDILLNKLHALCMEENWSTMSRSDKYWREAIKQKFNWIKVIWNKGSPWRLDNNILETPTKVATRLMQGKIDDLKTAQKDMQRVAVSLFLVLVSSALQGMQKFWHCSITTKSFLCAELAWGTKDKDVWQWLSKVVDHLGNDGMSLEDSEEEDMQTIFRVHGMPWRCDIDKELQFIDSKHKDLAISSSRGAKPVK